MASRMDVIMAGFDRNVAEEEYKTNKKIEDDPAIRAFNAMTAMAEGGEIGWSIGQSATAIKEGFQDMSSRFKRRRAMKKDFISKHGRKAWRSGMINDDGSMVASGRMMRRHALSDSKWTKDDLISVYMEGTNSYDTYVDGSISPTDSGKPPVNIKDYKSVQNYTNKKDFVGPVRPGVHKGGKVETPEPKTSAKTKAATSYPGNVTKADLMMGDDDYSYMKSDKSSNERKEKEKGWWGKKADNLLEWWRS